MDGDSRFNRLTEVAHEVMGRMLRGEPVGETDVANVARFAHVYLTTMRREGLITPADEALLDSDPDPSSSFAGRPAGSA